MKRLSKLLGLMLLVSTAQADSISTIQLQHRPAEEVIPIVEPMLGADDAISGQGFKIFLRSSPATLARVRDMIDVLDTPAKILQISVFQGSDRDLAELGVSDNVHIERGDASVDIGSEKDKNDDAGGSITYSTTDGSASINGFRSFVCEPFQPYNCSTARREEVIPIVEPKNESPGGGCIKRDIGSGPSRFSWSSGSSRYRALRPVERQLSTLARVRDIKDRRSGHACKDTSQISVFQGSDRDLAELGVSDNVHIERGDASVDRQRQCIGSEKDKNDDAGGSITYSTTDGSASINGISTHKSLRDNPIHQVRVTEGTEAHIETGERIPYFYGAAWKGRRGFAAGSIEYKDALTGFYVLPRIRGDNVTLEVSPFKSSRSNTGGDNIDTQSASTTITGRVGEWLLIGGVTEQLERTQSATGTTIATQSRGNTGIWIKADLVQ